MKINTILISLSLAIILPMYHAAFAQTSQQLLVETDSGAYTTGDIMTITGNAGSSDAGPLAEVVIWNPEGALYKTDIVQVAPDGFFIYETIVGGRQGINGTYQVVILYNQQQTETSFNFATSGTMLEVIIDDKSYFVLARAVSGHTSWLSILAEPESKSLVIGLDVAEPDTLKLELDKSLIDITPGCFVVHINDQLVDSRCARIDEQTTLLTLQAPAGANELSVMGSFLVPEFAFMLILLTGAFGSVMIVTRILQKRANM